MKKSTLITTIAMIVVVVVALSTATYAWFTSSAVSTATVEMQTTAASSLSLTVVTNVTDDTRSWANGETGIGIALTANQGLWAPEAALTNKLAYTESTLAGAGNTANFYPANFKSATKATQSADSTPKGLDAIRVTNIKGSALDAVYLYIIIAVDGGAANSNNLYAAQATSFYVSIAKSGVAATYATNGYGLGTAAEATYVPAEVTSETFAGLQADLWYQDSANENAWTSAASASFDSETAYYTKVTGFGNGAELTSTTAQEAYGLSAQENFAGTASTRTARPNYNGQTTGGFVQAQSDNIALGISANQYVLAYRIALGALDVAESLTLGVYNWIDGWTADNAAGNASYTVTYAFSDSTQTISVA